MPRFNPLVRVVACGLLILLLPCSLCTFPLYEYCQNNNTCGNIKFPVPFGVGNNGEYACGLPDFHINCVANRSVLEINDQNYTVLQISPNNETLFIVNDFEDGCQISNNSLVTYWNAAAKKIFEVIAQPIIDLNIYLCDGTCLPYYGSSCWPKGTATVQETVTKWKFNEANLYQSCSDCLNTHGYCGYNTSNSQFVCSCKDGLYPNRCPKGSKFNLGAVIGGSLAGIFLIAAVFLIFCVKRRKPSNHLQLCVLEDSKSSGPISKVEKFLQEYSHQMPTRFSYSQLKKFTNNFADKLGEGGFGVVYKGKLPNGNLVTVKIIDQTRFSEIQFMNEVATIGRTHHVHLVRLMGYCFEDFRTALVYEYMVNGSLDKFIFVGKGKQHILSWEQLYSIALGAARGIAYLHQDCDRRIIHFDIKPHNILLDAEFTAEVSDFGLAKLCGRGDDHVSITCARGTPGYVAPEIWSRNLGPVTEKSDVYSFGMLLLEIVGGRKNIDVQVSRPSDVFFPECAFRLWETGELESWLRGKGEMECEEEEKARRLTKIGLWCIQYSSTDRPSMSRVVQMLEGNGDDVSNPPFPFNSTLPAAPLLSSSEESSSSSMVQLHT